MARYICIGAAIGIAVGLAATVLVLIYGGDTLVSW